MPSRCRWSRRRGRTLRLLSVVGWSVAVPQAIPAQSLAKEEDRQAKAPTCPPQPFRWQEDCTNLRGGDLRGLDRYRYQSLADGRLWLSVGADARTRIDVLRDADFGIGGAPGYTEFSARLLAHADLHSAAGPRLFVQLGVVQESGRRPGARPQDESGPDVTQAFVDLPVRAGKAALLVRVGRQELSLSSNRLVTTRDGSTLRRTFQGLKGDVVVGAFRVALVRVRPMQLHDASFADRVDPTERFSAVSVDLPEPRKGDQLNLFLLDRKRENARYLRARGSEHRYTLGGHYIARLGDWSLDAQGAWQGGHVAGKRVDANGWALQFDRPLGKHHALTLEINIASASGDKASTAGIETFDPIYPNNYGLSDAPLFYQTNYIYAGGSLALRWAGATWSGGANLLGRHSVGDAVYANGAPIAAAFGHKRLTSVLSQLSVRKPVGRNVELYGSLVRANAVGSIVEAGGTDAWYSRLQLTARF